MMRHASVVFVAALCGVIAGCAPPREEAPAIPTATPLERSIVLLQEESRSKDPATHANCIEALQPCPDPRADEVIEQGLHDPEWIVRFAAAMATGKRKNVRLLPVVRGMAASDPNDSVRVGALYAMHRMGDNRYASTLSATLRSPDPATRANTAFVIGLIGDKGMIPVLRSRANEDDSRVKFEITAALARLGDSHAQDIIASLAISKFAEDQWNAMAICPELPSDLAANALVLGLQEPPGTPAALQDLTTRRQLVAARSLARMHSTQGAKVAIDNLKNGNPNLRALAAFALGELLAPQQDTALVPLLDDKDTGVRLAAAAAIVNIWARAEGK